MTEIARAIAAVGLAAVAAYMHVRGVRAWALWFAVFLVLVSS